MQTFCWKMLKISILSKFKKDGEGEIKKKKRSFSFNGSQMKHSWTFNPVSWISGHPELMHLLSAGTEEEVIAKISIAAF